MGFDYEIQKVKAVISDLGASRAFGSVYQNTSGRPILVIVTAAVLRQAANDAAFIRAVVEDAASPTDIVSSAGLLNLGPITQQRVCLVFAVPNNFYYEVTAVTLATGNVAKEDWWEVEL